MLFVNWGTARVMGRSPHSTFTMPLKVQRLWLPISRPLLAGDPEVQHSVCLQFPEPHFTSGAKIYLFLSFCGRLGFFPCCQAVSPHIRECFEDSTAHIQPSLSSITFPGMASIFPMMQVLAKVLVYWGSLCGSKHWLSSRSHGPGVGSIMRATAGMGWWLSAAGLIVTQG